MAGKVEAVRIEAAATGRYLVDVVTHLTELFDVAIETLCGRCSEC